MQLPVVKYNFLYSKRLRRKHNEERALYLQDFLQVFFCLITPCIQCVIAPHYHYNHLIVLALGIIKPLAAKYGSKGHISIELEN